MRRVGVGVDRNTVGDFAKEDIQFCICEVVMQERWVVDEGIDVAIKEIVVASKGNRNMVESTGAIDGVVACFMEYATRHAPFDKVAFAVGAYGLWRNDCFCRGGIVEASMRMKGAIG